jgi:hypothetical protein
VISEFLELHPPFRLDRQTKTFVGNYHLTTRFSCHVFGVGVIRGAKMKCIILSSSRAKKKTSNDRRQVAVCVRRRTSIKPKAGRLRILSLEVSSEVAEAPL